MSTVAVVGVGYWGSKLLRNFHSSEVWDVKYVCDKNVLKLQQLKSKYPSIDFVEDFELILRDDTVDAVAIATPVSTHYGITKKALEAYKHVWVEKPMTRTVEEAERLVEVATKNNVVLHVDHTFVYTSAVRKVKEISCSGELGDMLYFDSTRASLGLFQPDVSVLWDLAPHDFSILRYIVEEPPKGLLVSGVCNVDYMGKGLEDLVYVTVYFESGLLAHFHVNWLSPIKIRTILVGGSNKMLIYNDLELTEKIKVYDSGVNIGTQSDFHRRMIQYRVGDMYSPSLDNVEALGVACLHFHDCVTKNKATDSDGVAGLYVVKLLETADRSLREGKYIEV